MTTTYRATYQVIPLIPARRVWLKDSDEPSGYWETEVVAVRTMTIDFSVDDGGVSSERDREFLEERLFTVHPQVNAGCEPEFLVLEGDIGWVPCDDVRFTPPEKREDHDNA